MTRALIAALLVLSNLAGPSSQQPISASPAPVEGNIVLKNFHFRVGDTLPEVRMHYRTIGTLHRNAQGVADNAVLILHGSSGNVLQFLAAEFGGELFGPGQLLDAAKHFIVIPDSIGFGQSTKPSDGLRAAFPKYGYLDLVEGQYQLLKAMGVDHLRLIIGVSMGGMHTWLWGEEHPDMMDALMPFSCLPTQVSGRNRGFRRMVIDAITSDPEWKGGAYTAQPQSLRIAAEVTYGQLENPVRRYKDGPTLKLADERMDTWVTNFLSSTDANNLLYATRASEDYDPEPKLHLIKAPLFAVNFADDFMNPPELGVLYVAVKKLANGHAKVIPSSSTTEGHSTYRLAAEWKTHLAELLKISERRRR